MDKIKDCPFCNCGDVELHRNFDYVFCKNCGARGSFFDGHPQDAINAWNRVTDKSPKFSPINSPIRRINLDGNKGMTRG